MTEILYEHGYIFKYAFEETDNHQGAIKIALKYDKETKKPVIRELKRISKPGLRKFSKATDMPKVINGLGIAIVSTSKGLLTNKQCRDLGIGGEVLCFIS